MPAVPASSVQTEGLQRPIDMKGHTRAEMASRLLSSIQINDHDLHKMIKNMQTEAYKGLNKFDAQYPIKMLPSYVRRLPSGQEKGEFLALDLGGTNFRVCLVNLIGSGQFEIDNDAFVIPDEIKTGTGHGMFEYIAQSVARFLQTRNLTGRKLPLGFTFSFPTHQTFLAKGSLIRWTKGFTASSVVGENVVDILQAALLRENVHNVEVVALVNDTVGTLVAQAYCEPSARIGVILGTGTNAAVALPVHAVTKISQQMKELSNGKSQQDLPYMLINCEWGAFDPWEVITPSMMDRVVDDTSTNPTQQRFEKLISGLYLGELARLALVDILKTQPDAHSDEWPYPADNAPIWKTNSIDAADLSAISADRSANNSKATMVLSRTFGIEQSAFGKAPQDFIKELSKLLIARAARLATAGVAALHGLLDEESKSNMVVGMDGSVWLKCYGFQDLMRDALKALLGSEAASKVRFEDAPDGSGVGAALVAALAPEFH